MKPKLQRFVRLPQLFQCPVCNEALLQHETQLVCPNRHSFDLARQGYVNLARKQIKTTPYQKASFEQRHVILNAGFYDSILDALSKIMEQLQPKTVLDVGCGEGFYSRQLETQYEGDFFAFDLSKDSIQLAARFDERQMIRWFVADLAHIPIQSHTMDVILDIFSPANYAEFHRLLTEEGYVVKVVPNDKHLKELRAKLKGEKQHYSNDAIIEVFEEHFELEYKETVVQTTPLTEEEKVAFLAMTPLLFNEDIETLSLDDLNEMTIGADILVGRKK